MIPSAIDGVPVTRLLWRVNEKSESIGVFEDTAVKTAVIPNSVTLVGNNAFRNCKELTTVTMSDHCKYLNCNAFENCEKLERMDLSSTKLQTIDNLCFSGCKDLAQVRFPDTLEKIGAYAFLDCSALTDVRLPSDLAEVGKAAFGRCTALKTVSIPAKLDLYSIEESAFIELPSLEKVVFEEGRESLEGYAFLSTDTDVEFVIPRSVKTFESWTIFSHGACRYVFLGDFPELSSDHTELFGEPTVYYDPNTKGWDTCPWKDMYPMQPIQ